jgi:hypothetical protein
MFNRKRRKSPVVNIKSYFMTTDKVVLTKSSSEVAGDRAQGQTARDLHATKIGIEFIVR